MPTHQRDPKKGCREDLIERGRIGGCRMLARTVVHEHLEERFYRRHNGNQTMYSSTGLVESRMSSLCIVC